MNFKRGMALFVLAALGMFTAAGWAARAYGEGKETVEEVMLLKGDVRMTVNDSATYVTPWIKVRGANRIAIRTWSTITGAWATTDSAWTDSLNTFQVVFSDSVSFVGRDSAGTLVTYNRLIPTTSAHGPTFPVCTDSVMFTTATDATGDTTYKHVVINSPPLQEALRSSVNGGGHYTYILPNFGQASTTVYGDGAILPQYMRIRAQPRTRNTLAGAGSTQGLRTRGIRGLRMQAILFFK